MNPVVPWTTLAILISRQLLLYDLQRAGREIVLRGDKPHASTRLINLFEGVAHTSWKDAPVTVRVLLTGDKLVDDFDYRNQLIISPDRDLFGQPRVDDPGQPPSGLGNER